MNTKRTVLISLSAVAVVSALTLGSSTISSSGDVHFNAALNHKVGDVGEFGGTLKLGSTRYCDSFDPALSYDSWCGVILRTYSRNIVAYSNKPGADSFVIAPDLAANMPKSTDGGKEWHITLRDDVKWDDGTVVTSDDVKFSIERLFDPDILGTVSNDSLCLFSTCSTGIPDYEGPTASGELAAITTPTPNSVVIDLTRPFPGLLNVLAMPQFGVIERARVEELAKRNQPYSAAPASSGPFIIKPTTELVSFSTNKYWQQASDDLRIPKVDSMSWSLFPTSEAASQAVLAGDIDLRVDGGLTTEFAEATFTDSSRNKFLDEVPTGTVDYLALIPTAKPLERKACREAIFYALNKSDLVRIHGGSHSAQVATSLMSAGIPGGEKTTNSYPSGTAGTGDLEAARNKLSLCGYPDGFEIRMAYVALGLGKATYESVQRSLARVGIVVDPREYRSFADYFSTGVGSPENLDTTNVGIVAAAWSPEPGQSVSYWGPIVDGRKIKLRSNLNYSSINDDRINELLDSLENGTTKAGKLNSQIDSLVMKQALYVPFVAELALNYRGPQLTNVYVQRALGGQYDLVNVGLVTK
jgi:peptide/nickel transport system substrate-binding protein